MIFSITSSTIQQWSVYIIGDFRWVFPHNAIIQYFPKLKAVQWNSYGPMCSYGQLIFSKKLCNKVLKQAIDC